MNSIGGITEFLRAYWNSNAHETQIGNGKVYYFDKVMAELSFEKDSEVPVFNFSDEYSFLEESQKINRAYALKLYFGTPRYITPDDIEEFIFIGSLKYKEVFDRKDKYVDCFFDREGRIIYAHFENGEIRKINLFCSDSVYPVEKQAREHAWAVIKTRNWNQDMNYNWD